MKSVKEVVRRSLIIRTNDEIADVIGPHANRRLMLHFWPPQLNQMRRLKMSTPHVRWALALTDQEFIKGVTS